MISVLCLCIYIDKLFSPCYQEHHCKRITNININGYQWGAYWYTLFPLLTHEEHGARPCVPNIGHFLLNNTETLQILCTHLTRFQKDLSLKNRLISRPLESNQNTLSDVYLYKHSFQVYLNVATSCFCSSHPAEPPPLCNHNNEYTLGAYEGFGYHKIDQLLIYKVTKCAFLCNSSIKLCFGGKDTHVLSPLSL